jgi:hypothetical protein
VQAARIVKVNKPVEVKQLDTSRPKGYSGVRFQTWSTNNSSHCAFAKLSTFRLICMPKVQPHKIGIC